MQGGGRAFGEPLQVATEHHHHPVMGHRLGREVHEPRQPRTIVVNGRQDTTPIEGLTKLQPTTTLIAGEQTTPDVEKLAVWSTARGTELQEQQRCFEPLEPE